MVSAEYSRNSRAFTGSEWITRNPTVDLRAVDLSVLTQPDCANPASCSGFERPLAICSNMSPPVKRAR